MTSVELRAEREKNRLKMKEQVQANIKAGTPTSDEAYKRFEEEDAKLLAEIRDIEFSEKLERETVEKAEARKEMTPPSKLEQEQRYQDVFLKHLFRRGQLNSDEKQILYRGTGNQTTTDAEGGFMIPTGFSDQLFVEKALWGGMFEAADIINTPTGNDLVWPKVDDTAATGSLVAEAAALTVEDIAFTALTLNAWMYSSDVVKVSEQVDMDSAFLWANILSPMFARRLGTIQNLHFTTGDASSKPNGIVTASSTAATTASATAVTRTELNTLEHAVNPAYRNRANPKCGFMFNDTTLGAIKAVSMATAASDNGPLWTPGLRAGERDRVNGWPVFINQDVASMASTTKAILFGDFSQYKIRKAGPTTAKRLDELYAANLLKGYFAFERYDGDLLGTNAVKFLTQAT